MGTLACLPDVCIPALIQDGLLTAKKHSATHLLLTDQVENSHLLSACKILFFYTRLTAFGACFFQKAPVPRFLLPSSDIIIKQLETCSFVACFAEGNPSPRHLVITKKSINSDNPNNVFKILLYIPDYPKFSVLYCTHRQLPSSEM